MFLFERVAIMGNLIIEVDSPYPATLFVNQQPPVSNENRCFKFDNIVTGILYDLKIVIEKENQHSKIWNDFGKKTEIFDNFYYDCKFKIISNKALSKIKVKYIKESTLDIDNNKIQIPYLNITNKNVVIVNEESSIFKRKTYEFFYFIKQIWLPILIIIACIATCCTSLIHHMMNYFKGSEFVNLYYRELAFSYSSAFIIYISSFFILTVFLIFLLLYWYKRFKRMQGKD